MSKVMVLHNAGRVVIGEDQNVLALEQLNKGLSAIFRPTVDDFPKGTVEAGDCPISRAIGKDLVNQVFPHGFVEIKNTRQNLDLAMDLAEAWGTTVATQSTWYNTIWVKLPVLLMGYNWRWQTEAYRKERAHAGA